MERKLKKNDLEPKQQSILKTLEDHYVDPRNLHEIGIFRNRHSLRLTYVGFLAYSKVKTPTKIYLNKPHLSPAELLILSQNMTEPYYVELVRRVAIYVFDEETAAMLILADSDIKFLKN